MLKWLSKVTVAKGKCVVCCGVFIFLYFSFFSFSYEKSGRYLASLFLILVFFPIQKYRVCFSSSLAKLGQEKFLLCVSVKIKCAGVAKHCFTL